MVVTSDTQAAQWLRTASLHGLSREGRNRYANGGSPHYEMLLAGFKYNMMDLQAALGLGQLARLEAHWCAWRSTPEQLRQALVTAERARQAIGDGWKRWLPAERPIGWDDLVVATDCQVRHAV